MRASGTCGTWRSTLSYAHVNSPTASEVEGMTGLRLLLGSVC
ncbi:hypothetical protein AB0I53_31385 [Saccharopolyspora sp. NPDC050389]